MSEQESLSRTVTSETNSQITRTVLRLREMILSGDFRPGERVSEAPLTGRLGASRTPIRLALERLAHEGLLDPYPTGGFIVRTFTLEDVWDGIEIRGVLDGAAARLAAERLPSDADIAGLRTCQDDMDALGEPTPETLPQYLEHNDRFHDEIVRLSRSMTLKRSLDRLLSMPLASRQALVSLRMRFPEASDIFIVGRDQHLRIIEAISKRQGARAENIAREHAVITRRALEFALAHAHELGAFPGVRLLRR